MSPLEEKFYECMGIAKKMRSECEKYLEDKSQKDLNIILITFVSKVFMDLSLCNTESRPEFKKLFKELCEEFSRDFLVVANKFSEDDDD